MFRKAGARLATWWEGWCYRRCDEPLGEGVDGPCILFSMKEYDVISRTGTAAFVANVNQALAAGYKLIAGLSAVNVTTADGEMIMFFQAIAK